MTSNVDPIYNIDKYANEIKYRMQITNERVKDLLNKSKITQKQQYDKKAKSIKFNIADKVLLIDHSRHKHKPIYKGPYKIISLDDKNVKLLEINSNKTYTTHKNNIIKYIS